MRPVLPDIKNKKDITKKETIDQYLTNIDPKILKKNNSKFYTTTYRKDMHDQVGFIPEMNGFNIQK